ncbi:MAG: CDP-alcohol phosphatidyltransferase family protein [Pseudomonadota bacterium]
MSVPNLITLFRILLVPLTIWLIVTEQFLPAFFAFVVAGISDGIDGFVAKRFNQVTELGAYLDPLADKLLLVSIYLALGIDALMPPLLVITVVSRDVMIIGAVILSWLLDKPVEVQPLWISKINTTVQIAFAGFVLAGLGMNLELESYVLPGGLLVGALTVASGAAYMLQWTAHMANGKSHDHAHQPEKDERGA